MKTVAAAKITRAIQLGSCVDMDAEELDALEKVVIGLPRVAEAIIPLAPEDKERALAAVEGAYQKAAAEFGYSPSQAEGWAAAIMADLRTEIDKQSVPNRRGEVKDAKSSVVFEP
jgi:hypothetical protein